MLTENNKLKHNKFRGHIQMAREGVLYSGMDFRKKVSYFALELTRLGIAYGTGGRYAMQSEHDEPATWSRQAKQGDMPPALECAGFVEMILYGLKQIDGDIFNYRGLRKVPWGTEFYERAALGDHNYEPNWIPGARRPATITELNGMGAWAQTPVLLFFRYEFEPLGKETPLLPGDVLSFMSHDRAGYHFHSAIWIKTERDEGLAHSSPSSNWDGKDGPKYTPLESPYYQFFLFPMRLRFEERFGASVVRLKDIA